MTLLLGEVLMQCFNVRLWVLDRYGAGAGAGADAGAGACDSTSNSTCNSTSIAVASQ